MFGQSTRIISFARLWFSIFAGSRWKSLYTIFAMNFPISLFIAVVDDVRKCHDQVNTFDVKELAILSLLTASTTFRVLKSVEQNLRNRQLTKPSTGMCFGDRYKNGKLNSRKLSFMNTIFYGFCALIISVLWFYCLTLCNANKKKMCCCFFVLLRRKHNANWIEC